MTKLKQVLTGVGDVSRETSDRLELYAQLVRKWQAKINLISPKTLDDLEKRHFVDSAQLCRLVPATVRSCVDLGSGGGFPGLVATIIFAETAPAMKVTLIESDVRKCTFLREVVRQTQVSATVITGRIETTPPQNADVVMARALAPLPRLLPWAKRHLATGGKCLFLKGAHHAEELADVADQWQMNINVVASLTAPDAAILELSDLRHVQTD